MRQASGLARRSGACESRLPSPVWQLGQRGSLLRALKDCSHSSRQLQQNTWVQAVTVGSSTKFWQIGHSKTLKMPAVEGTTSDVAIGATDHRCLRHSSACSRTALIFMVMKPKRVNPYKLPLGAHREKGKLRGIAHGIVAARKMARYYRNGGVLSPSVLTLYSNSFMCWLCRPTHETPPPQHTNREDRTVTKTVSDRETGKDRKLS